jgi:peptidoglycan/LPS O-acetylase OafA/YrhL
MLLFLGAFLVICLFRSRILLTREFDSIQYISRDRTQAINGIFAVLILMSHTFGIVDTQQTFLDTLYEPIKVFMGQFVVVTFLFFSGYGIMESILHKKDYIRSFPKKRLLKLWLQFAAITVVYVILNLALRTGESLFTYLFSFIGLTTIGNGGWFMFAIFVLYVIVILSFFLCRKKPLAGAILTTALVACVIVAELVLGFPSYYFSTMIFFPLGMLFSFAQKTFIRIVTANHWIWGILTLVSTAGFVLLKSLDFGIILYPVWCGFGLLMILLLSLKVKLENPVLVWLGQNAFSIFMLQGIPQELFPLLPIPYNVLTYAGVFAATVGLTFLYNWILRGITGASKRSAASC